MSDRECAAVGDDIYDNIPDLTCDATPDMPHDVTSAKPSDTTPRTACDDTLEPAPDVAPKDVAPKDLTPADTNSDKLDTVSSGSDRLDMASSGSSSSKPSSIVLVCDEDGVPWAEFFKVKMAGQDYSFSTWIEQFDTCDAILVTEKTKTQVVLLSPSLLEDSANGEKLLSFCMDSCIFILLGVDENDVKKAFSEECSMDILSFPHHMIVEEKKEESLKEALVKIIKSYEDDKTGNDDDDGSPIYESLPLGKPVQVNKLVKVIPSDDLKGGSDVYLFLDHEAEDPVSVVIDRLGGTSLPATLIDTAVYTFTLPDETSGDVSIKVECKQKNLGQHTTQAASKLEQLRSLLDDVADPVSLMCQALSIPRNAAILDRRLAEQVKNNWPMHTMPFLMQMFDLQEPSEETSSEVWPTVLHFAAHYNLELLCTELLKYPGMINAAMTANVNEKYPCEIAKEKGFTSLGKQLYSFVEKQGRHPDSGVVIDTPAPCAGPGNTPAPCVGPGNTPAPCPGAGYVNAPPIVHTDDSYLDMDTVDTSVLSSHFKCDTNGDGRGIRISNKPCAQRTPPGDPDIHHSASVPKSFMQSPSPSLVIDNSSDSSDDYMVPNPNIIEKPESLDEFISKISNKPKKTYSLREQRRPDSHKLLPPPPGVGKPSSPTADTLTKPRSYSLGTEQNMKALERIQNEDPGCRGLFDTPLTEELHDPFPKQISPPLRGEVKKTSRFSKFINKFRRHDSDLSLKGDKKTKAPSSKQLFQNLNKSVNAGRKYSETAGQPIELERDSGSYSDDDDLASSSHSPGYHKKHVAKSGTKPTALSRKESVRVVRARNEKMDNAPTLPLRAGRTGYH